MLKRILTMALASLIIISAMTFSASAVEIEENELSAEANSAVGAEVSNSDTGSGNLIYVDFGSCWKNVKVVYCHIWERGGDNFYGWQSKGEICKKVSDTKYSYDLDLLESGKINSGKMTSAKDYCVIFSADTGSQTFDTTIGLECVGDTLKLLPNLLECAVDSNISTNSTEWTKNSSKYGPHLTITSIGNVVGSKLCPHESPTESLGEFLLTYYKSAYIKDIKASLKSAMGKFGFPPTQKNCLELYSYISSKSGVDKAEVDVCKEIIESVMIKESSNGSQSETLPAKAPKYEPNKTKGNTPQSNNNSTNNTNYSQTGPDGQSDYIFLALGMVMVLSAVTFVLSRKKREC